jgi:hypothetical protein
MKFMLTFTWNPDTRTRTAGIEPFQKTGGPPPDGGKLRGRWTRADLGEGFDLLETDNPDKLAEFACRVERLDATGHLANAG